jgi:hypothetical protein
MGRSKGAKAQLLVLGGAQYNRSPGFGCPLPGYSLLMFYHWIGHLPTVDNRYFDQPILVRYNNVDF